MSLITWLIVLLIIWFTWSGSKASLATTEVVGVVMIKLTVRMLVSVIVKAATCS